MSSSASTVCSICCCEEGLSYKVCYLPSSKGAMDATLPHSTPFTSCRFLCSTPTSPDERTMDSVTKLPSRSARLFEMA